MNDILANFRRFESKSRVGEIFVSLRKTGHIAFSMASVNKYNLDSYKYGILFFSKENKKAAVKFTNDKTERGSRKICKRSGNFSICATGFLKHCDFNSKETVNVDFDWHITEQTAIFSVSNGKPHIKKKWKQIKCAATEI